MNKYDKYNSDIYFVLFIFDRSWFVSSLWVSYISYISLLDLSLSLYIYMYIYIYMERERECVCVRERARACVLIDGGKGINTVAKGNSLNVNLIERL